MDSEDLAWLSAAAAAGSLSAAAKRGAVAVSTVARRIESLEALLRLRLLDRRPGGISLTADGARILELAGPLLAAADRIRRQAEVLRDGAGRPAVTVSATEFVTAEFLAPALPRLVASDPLVKVSLRAQPETVSLAGRDADIAVRMSRPEGASLIARKLPAQPLGLFASEAYLEGREPARIDLGSERLLSYDDSYGPIAEATWAEREGLSARLTMTTSSTHALMSAAAMGAGIALLPARFARRSGLVEVTAPFQLPTRVPWIIVHRDLRRVREIASVHRWIVGVFKEEAQRHP